MLGFVCLEIGYECINRIILHSLTLGEHREFEAMNVWQCHAQVTGAVWRILCYWVGVYCMILPLGWHAVKTAGYVTWNSNLW